MDSGWRSAVTITDIFADRFDRTWTRMGRWKKGLGGGSGKGAQTSESLYKDSPLT